MLLKSIKVLDLSNLLPGPMCSLFLADLGADVVKIESLQGDFMRHVDSGKKSPYFSALNRNKKSIALNLKSKHGKDIFMKLAKNADVVIEGFRPSKVDSLGISYKNIKKINPKIIYCSITGYGQKGFYRNKAGHDLNYSALSGLLDVLSDKPLVPGVQIADVGSALIAAFAIVASLFYRERNKKGNYIDVSVFNSALSLISIHIAQRSLSSIKTVLSGNKPCYNVYETRDKKFVSLGAIEDKFWKSFCNAIGRKDFVKRKFDESAVKGLRKLFKEKSLHEWVELNGKYDFCCEPVRKIKDVVNDVDLNKGAIITIDGIKQASFPAIFSYLGRISYKNPPKLGEHTDHLLSGIGYNKKGIDELRKRAVIL